MADLLQWDVEGQKYFEGGISKVVLFVKENAVYGDGVAWSGITGIDESPDGGDANEIWADNISYAKIRGQEKFGITINAYTYPVEFEECDGSKRPSQGVVFGQQARKAFGLAYRTEIGSDDLGDFSKGYKIHLVYGCTTSPVEKSHETLNDSPDAETFSWTVDATPAKVVEHTGFKPVAHIVIDSRDVDSTKLTSFEAMIYGTAAVTGTNAVAAVPARLPSPDEIIDHFGAISNG